MQIRCISDSEKESITEYLKLLEDLVGKNTDLVEMIYDNKKILVSSGESAVGVVINDGDTLKPYFINMDDKNLPVFGNLTYIFNVADFDLKEVIQTNVIDDSETRVSYLKRTDNNPRDIIVYFQYLSGINSCLEFRYDVTMRNTLEHSLAYTLYQLPDDIRFEYLKKYGPIVKKKKHFYGRSIDEENVYYSPLFVIKEIPCGQKSKTFDGHILMQQFENLGFEKNIPFELSSILTDTNEEYKTLKLINNQYKNYIKGQK